MKERHPRRSSDAPKMPTEQLGWYEPYRASRSKKPRNTGVFRGGRGFLGVLRDVLRSLKTTCYLQFQGFTRVSNKEDGLLEWMRKNFPVVGQRYGAPAAAAVPSCCGGSANPETAARVCCGGDPPTPMICPVWPLNPASRRGLLLKAGLNLVRPWPSLKKSNTLSGDEHPRCFVSA
jgi:hypothetical protein